MSCTDDQWLQRVARLYPPRMAKLTDDERRNIIGELRAWMMNVQRSEDLRIRAVLGTLLDDMEAPATSIASDDPEGEHHRSGRRHHR